MERSLYSRAETAEQHYPFAVMALAPLLAVFIQAYLPLRFPRLEILDLPLIVTLYFALARHSQAYGAFLGTGTGILQDALTHLPLGINGICKAIVGYLAASVSTRLDVDNTGARLIIVLVLTMLHSVLHLIIVRLMLDLHPGWHWGYEFLRAALNTAVSLIFFRLLDLFRRQN